MNPRYFFDTDLAGNWFLVAASKRHLWNKWKEYKDKLPLRKDIARPLPDHPRNYTFEMPYEFNAK